MKKCYPCLVWILILFLVTGVTACGNRGDGGGGDDSSESTSEDTGDDSDASSDSDSAANSDSDSDKNSKSKKGGKDNGKKAGDDDEEDEEEGVPVELAGLTNGTIESLVRSSANLEAENQVQVHSEAARLVQKLEVEEGDVVKKGNLLLRLQNDEQRSNLAKAEARFAQAQTEYDRQKRLFDREVASEQAFNNATHDYDQRKIELDDAKRELAYTEVRAPISGTITARLVSLGDQVQLGQHLFDIVDFDSIVARVYVPEKHIAALAAGQPARVTAEAVSSQRYDAVIDRIAPIVDPRTGTVKVTVAIGRQPGLLPGMFVDVDLVTAVHDDVLLLPKRAVVYDNDRIFVYRLAPEDRVEQIEVMPMLIDRDFIEPFPGTFEFGDSIVVAGQAGLKDGALIIRVNREELLRKSSSGDADADQAAK